MAASPLAGGPEDLQALGVSHLLSKPFTLQRLIDFLESLGGENPSDPRERAGLTRPAQADGADFGTVHLLPFLRDSWQRSVFQKLMSGPTDQFRFPVIATSALPAIIILRGGWPARKSARHALPPVCVEAAEWLLKEATSMQHPVHMGPGHTFNPATITIHINDEIVWINDGGSHNAAGANGTPEGFDTGDVLGTSAPVPFNFLSTDPLGFRYSCTAHHPNDMIGHVIVVPAGTPLPALANKAKKADRGAPLKPSSHGELRPVAGLLRSRRRTTRGSTVSPAQATASRGPNFPDIIRIRSQPYEDFPPR